MKVIVKSVLLIALFVFIGLGCSGKDKGGQAKSGSQAEAETQLPPNHPPLGDVNYKVPQGWIAEQPASQMRKSQFRWPGVEGSDDAVLAEFFFPGGGGSVEANLERWYGQFRQPDGSETASHVKRDEKTVNGLKVTIVYVAGTYLQPKNAMMMSGPVDEMKNYAMLAAIVETPNGPYFFKAVGPQKTVDHWKPSFYQFVETLRFE